MTCLRQRVHAKNTVAGINTRDYADNTKGVWYFPVKDEVQILFAGQTYDDLQLPPNSSIKEAVNNTLSGIGKTQLSDWYWSSTEKNDKDVWVVDFSDGYTSAFNKRHDVKVRAVVAF